jgi:hypothetical protein
LKLVIAFRYSNEEYTSESPVCFECKNLETAKYELEMDIIVCMTSGVDVGMEKYNFELSHLIYVVSDNMLKHYKPGEYVNKEAKYYAYTMPEIYTLDDWWDTHNKWSKK